MGRYINYYMQLKTKYMGAAPVLALLLLAVTGAPAKAWDGPGGCNFSCGGPCEFSCHNGLSDSQIVSQASGVCGGYCAGEQDAIFDLQNNMPYQPQGNCLPCHSQDYWDNFHQGYNSYWNSHQQQESTQGSSINIYGNNNYVSTNQYSNQQQNPLQQLAHLACGFTNCGGNSGPYYGQTAYGGQEQGP